MTYMGAVESLVRDHLTHAAHETEKSYAKARDGF